MKRKIALSSSVLLLLISFFVIILQPALVNALTNCKDLDNCKKSHQECTAQYTADCSGGVWGEIHCNNDIWFPCEPE